MNFSYFTVLLRELFGPVCPGCRTHLAEKGTGFCAECREKLPLLLCLPNRCPGCGGRNEGLLEKCSQCLAEPDRLWKQAAAAVEYRDFARELVHRYKFGNAPELARPFARLLAEAVKESKMVKPELLVPIPLSLRRKWQRGYNQAELLAMLLAQELHCPVANVLVRRDNRTRQSERSQRARHTALGNVFRVRNIEMIKGKRLLLVDDILTTGATLQAAAKKLLKAGAASIDVAVFARTIRHIR